MNAPAIAIWAGVTLLLILLWLVYRYSLFVPAPAGLPILIYHKVSRDHEDELTISPARLDSQLAYIRSQGYTSVSFLDLKAALDGGRPLHTKPVLLTFDDDQIRELAGTCIEFGLHSYRHENFQPYSPAQAEADVSECVRVLEENHCPFTPVFAYPYGRMPLDKSTDRALRDSFRRHGIDFAARIGSRINTLPLKDVYEMKRTIIRGTDSFWEFKTKLRKGRVKFF